ncbi:MAG: sigma-70 family RNA polymerase sigma factor [Verrucomicrobiota bacterium]|nr:sigma-70 family RNA polymerase sigma factor [Verrucomicrobiota bacterium]
MKAIPGTLQGGGATFPDTHWSMVVGRESSPGSAEGALAELCGDYWPPLYAFVRRRGYSAHDAQDLTQAFFAYLIESKAHTRADRDQGKFRTFLLVVLKRFLSGAHAHEQRLKRGGGQRFVFLDPDLAAVEALCASESPLSEERLFEWHWAEALVGRAMKGLRAEYAVGAKTRIFAELQPFLTGGARLPSQEEVAARLNVPIETLRSHLSRLRARYRELLRAEIARTVARDAEVDEELRYLCQVLIARS